MNSNHISATGLQCLQFLFSQVRRNVNFSSLISQQILDECAENPVKIIMQLADNQQLAPEQISSFEPLKLYRGPVLMQLENESWILLLNSNQLNEENTEVSIIDPEAGQKILKVPAAQLLERANGTAVIVNFKVFKADILNASLLNTILKFSKKANSLLNILSITE